jgi:excisionase family DNA binding protein
MHPLWIGNHMTNWLSLNEAAKVLGVHPSTLRRWSDEGHLPSVRTEGGHRRYNRDALSTFLEKQQEKPSAPLAPTKQGAMDNPPAHWREGFQGKNVEELRQVGQRLLGLLMQYLTRQNEDDRFLLESRRVGNIYGKESLDNGLAMLDTVEAFLYFRSHFSEMIIQLPTFPRAGDDEELRRLTKRTDRFMNEVLLGVIEGYMENGS